jgi:hypothetical protein
MARYLLEVPHPAQAASCTRSARILLESGSHFLTRADFGCGDGVHVAWIVVDVDSRTEARNLIPPAYRKDARVVALSRFSLEELGTLIEYHQH